MSKQEEELTAVCLVCGPVAALPHVTGKISVFLFEEGSSRWTLVTASERGFVRLLDRLLQCQWARYSDYFRNQRLKKGITSAVKSGYDLRVLHWWLHCYVADQTEYGLEFVLELAIGQAQLPVLEWIHQETQGQLPSLIRTVSCCSPEVIYWLYEHGGRHLPVKLWLQSLQPDARCAFIQWCIERGGDCKSSFGIPQDAMKGAAEHSMEMLQQLLEIWPELCTPESLNAVVEKGQFEAIKWLYDSRPALYFSDGRIHSKAFNGNPEAVRWIVFDVVWRAQAARLAWIHGAIHVAVCNGELDLFHSFVSLHHQIIMDTSIEDDTVKLNLLDEAVRRGYLEIALWLLDHGSRGCCSRTVDDVAMNGNMESLLWLHQNQSQAFTTNAMDNAAAMFGLMGSAATVVDSVHSIATHYRY